MNEGLRFIYQELNLVPQIDIARNLFLGTEPLRSRRLGIIDTDNLYRNLSKILIGLWLIASLVFGGCVGTVLPREVYRVRNVLVSYYHSLLRLEAHRARAHLIPGGESDNNFNSIFREFRAFRSRPVQQYDHTTARIVRFDIEVEGERAFVRSFVVSFCDWDQDEAHAGFSWTGACGQCPGYCGELHYPDFNGTARLVDGWWLLE